jgi:aspartate carbamoyltransferase catalytic subunit
MRHLIRTSDFTKEEILKIFDDAREFKIINLANFRR